MQMWVYVRVYPVRAAECLSQVACAFMDGNMQLIAALSQAMCTMRLWEWHLVVGLRGSHGGVQRGLRARGARQVSGRHRALLRHQRRLARLKECSGISVHLDVVTQS